MELAHYLKFIERKQLNNKFEMELFSYSIPIYSHLDFTSVYIYKEQVTGDIRKCSLLSAVGNCLVKIITPEVNKNNFGFGSLPSTEDLMLFIFENDELEIFVAKGMKYFASLFFNLLSDNEFEKAILELRSRAVLYNEDSINK